MMMTIMAVRGYAGAGSVVAIECVAKLEHGVQVL